MVASTLRITRHVRERYLERSDKKYLHLSNCKRAGCPHCISLIYSMRTTIQENQFSIDQSVREKIHSAQEVRSYLNDSKFMSFYYDKYGYDRVPRFMVNDDLLFVLIADEQTDRDVVLTCMWASKHVVGKKRMKFKKKVDNLCVVK